MTNLFAFTLTPDEVIFAVVFFACVACIVNFIIVWRNR